MNPKKDILVIASIAMSLGLGTPTLFAQNAPGGPQVPSRPGGPTGPTVPQPDLGVPNPGSTVPRPGPSLPPTEPQPGRRLPQPDPGVPREVEPTIPGQPAPGLPQREPIPGRPGAIPERSQGPNIAPEDMVVTPSHVKKAQDALKAKGLNPGIDGKMDPATQQALQDFQKKNNLPATGVLDEKTAAKLGVNLKN